MSKQIKRAMIAILLTGLLLGAFLSFSSDNAGFAQRRAIPTRVRPNAALLAATTNVLRETSKIRELSIVRQVRSSTQTRSEIERMIIKSLNEETTPAELRATELTWKKLGLVPADFQYRDFLIHLLTEQVAGYYEPKSKQFYLADWIDLDAQKPVMAHELTHALQDQHFNLRRFEKWPKNDADAELAARALIEGDASLAMELYIADNPMRALSFLKSITAGMAATEQLDRAPRALRESLLFPYFEGRVWAKELYKRGGWAEVSRAFTELPKSTEQILHADKYFAREPVVKVEIPELAPLLNRNAPNMKSLNSEGSLRSGAFGPQPPAPGPWKRVDYDVNGEWGYYLILDEFLKSSDESRRAAAGWGGDRYAVYEGPRLGEVLLAQISVWDTEKDASEFFDAYAKRVQRRYADAERIDLPAPESETLKTNSQNRQTYSWRTSQGSVVLSLRGARVSILEGLPPNINVQNAVRALGSVN